MLDIGWSELLVLVIVAIVVVGPKDLPKLMRTVGFYVGKARRAAADFQRQFNEAVAESEAEEVRKNLEAIKANMGPAPDLSQPIGKPLMTGPKVPETPDLVQPPRQEVDEPKLPEPKRKLSSETKTAKKVAAKSSQTKKTSAKSAVARKKAPTKRKPRKAKAASPETAAALSGEAKDGESKP